MSTIRTLATSSNRLALTTVVVAGLIFAAGGGKTAESAEPATPKTLHKTVTVDGLDIFYREAGLKDAPKKICVPSCSRTWKASLDFASAAK